MCGIINSVETLKIRERLWLGIFFVVNFQTNSNVVVRKVFPSKYFSIQFINYPVFFLLAADFSQSTGTQLWHNFLVMIQTLKKDFSRFEEIQILRTVSVEEQKQAPVVKKLDREIKRTLRKKRKESYSIIFLPHW